MNKYYQILGLQPGASKDQIKRAYRKLAMRFHPDINKQPGAREKFIRLTEAYNYLMNPPKRVRNYDVEKAEEERKRRAREMAQRAARQRYAAFKRRQEIAQSKSYSQGVTIFVGIILLVAAGYFGKSTFTKYYVSSDPVETIGRISFWDHRHITIDYKVGDAIYREKISGSRSKRFLLTPNGMPVVSDGEFLVRYNREDPDFCVIDFDRITPLTLKKYLRVISGEASKILNVPAQDSKLECVGLQVFDAYGAEGLANIFFWQEHPLDNLGNNSFTFGRMQKEEEYQQILKNCNINAEN